MTSTPSNLAPPSATAPTAAASVLPVSAAASLLRQQQPPPSLSAPQISSVSRSIVERAAILRFVRDGFIIRTPGIASWDSSVARFCDLNRNFISEVDFDFADIPSGSAREFDGVQILFGPKLGGGLDRAFLGRAQRSRYSTARSCSRISSRDGFGASSDVAMAASVGP
jgi:hypothetical protein